MNYDFLLHDRTLPNYFKYISLISIIAIIAMGLYMKFTNSMDIGDITPGMLKWFLYLSLCMHLISKDKIEDERNKEIQLQIFRIGFRLFLGVIMILFGGSLLGDDFKGYPAFYFFVISILGYLVIFSESAKKSNVVDLIEKYRFLYLTSIVLTMLAILFFNKWLWGWPTI